MRFNIIISVFALSNALFLPFFKEVTALIVLLQCLFLLFFSKLRNDYFILIYLFAFMYFGVSVFGLKIYDIIFIVFIGLKLFSAKFYHNRIIDSLKGNRKYLYVFGIALLLRLVFPSEVPLNLQVLELVRYLFCLLILIFIVPESIGLEKLYSSVTILSLLNILSGIVIFIYHQKGLIGSEYTGFFLDVDLFDPAKESRLAGFFSDPNKYYLFFSYLYLIVLYKVGQSKKSINLLLILTIVGLVISLSRIALLISVVYLLLLLFDGRVSSNGIKKLFYLSIISAVILFIITLPLMIEHYDQWVNDITVLLGREESLRYSPSLTESNRVKAWGLAIESIKESPFLGGGLGLWNSFFSMPPHNTFLSILLDIGIMGLLLFYLLFYPLWKQWFKPHVLVLLILPMLTLDLQNLRLLFVLLIFVIDHNKTNFRINESIDFRTGSVR